MQPPVGLPRGSIGGMRPPSLPVVASMPTNGSMPLPSPPHSNVHPNGVNGVNRTGNAVGQVPANADTPLNSSTPNGTLPPQPDGAPVSNDSNVVSPVRPKSQDQHRAVSVPNGYHLTAVNGYTAMANGSFLHHPNASLSNQQVQTLKSAFNPDVNAIQANATRQFPPVSYMGHVVANGTNFNMSIGGGNPKLPAARQMQWASPPLQRPTGNNGVDSSGMPSNMASSPSAHSTVGPPVRTPSSNGSRNGNGIRGGIQATSHVIGQMSPHSPSPMAASLSQGQVQPSPPRLPQTPTMTMVSPSLQHQQPVGSSQSGY